MTSSPMLARHAVQLMVVMVTVSVVVTRELCVDMQSRCIQRVGCGMALQNYLVGCADLVNRDDYDLDLDTPRPSRRRGGGRRGGRGQERACLPRCRRALISLLSTEDGEGEQFMTCDCQGEEFCVEQRQRLDVCGREVMSSLRAALDDTTPIDCSLAEMICEADTSCQAALDYYRDHCRQLFDGKTCSKRCNNSIAILHRQDKGRKLATCHCDGSEGYNCPALRHHTQRLCYPYPTPPSPHTRRHRPPTTPPLLPHSGDVVVHDVEVPLPRWPQDYDDGRYAILPSSDVITCESRSHASSMRTVVGVVLVAMVTSLMCV